MKDLKCIPIKLHLFTFHLQQNVDKIIEEVKNICSVLGCVETKQITDAVNELNLLLQRKVKVNILIYYTVIILNLSSIIN